MTNQDAKMIDKMEGESWEEEYCKKFGLCDLDNHYRCDCKKEINFIRKLLQLSKEQYKREVVEKIKELHYFIAENKDKKEINIIRLDDILNLLK